MKILDKLFDVVVTVQVIFTLIFFIENYNHLGNLTYIAGGAEVVIDFYSATTVLGIIAAAIMLFTTFLSNEQAAYTIGKLLGYILIFYVFSAGLGYYLSRLLDAAWVIIDIFCGVIYVIHFAVNFAPGEDM
jgi:hypothetical protein